MTSQEDRSPDGPQHAMGIRERLTGRWLPGLGTLISSVGASAVVAAVVGSWVAGAQDATNAKTAFIRDQHISAYAAFTHDLILFEDDYKKASELLELPKDQAPPLSTPEPGELIRAVGIDLDNLRRSKALVDIVGTPTMKNDAQNAIDIYGPAKGEISDDLTARLKGLPAAHGGSYASTITKMQTQGRDIFTNDANKELA